MTGQSFEHRRAWLERRILLLVELFAVDLYAYAVMSNHYHLVVHVKPHEARAWTPEDVARRWDALCPRRPDPLAEKAGSQPSYADDKIEECRERLSSLSWFMRFINEPLARLANREDDCTGRFWSGRFKSIALLDASALLACMAYVDLNPVRAQVAETPEEGEYTSIRHRLRDTADTPMAPIGIAGRSGVGLVALSVDAYRQLLEWTAAADSGGADPPSLGIVRSLMSFGHSRDHWLPNVRAHRRKFRAYGRASSIESYVRLLRQRWIRHFESGALLARPV